LLSAVLVGVFVLLLGANSLASSQFAATAEVTYLSQKLRSSSGLRTVITWSDPGEPSGKPKAVKSFNLRFHRGTKFDTSALPMCKASRTAVRRLGTRACPAASKLGSGYTEAIASADIRFKTVVTLFNARRQIIVLVQVNGRTLTEFRDDVKGRSLAVNAEIPSGISLTKLDVRIPAHSRTSGGKRIAYMRTPGVCPVSGAWTTLVTLTYVDGSSQAITTASPCSQR
jgi:hypothetical protein